MVAGMFHGGIGIGLTTDGIKLFGDLKGIALDRALKDHVFDEMGQATLGLGLVTGTHVNPNPHGNGANIGHRHGNDADTVVQEGFIYRWLYAHLPERPYD